MYRGNENASVTIVDSHTNIVEMTKNDAAIMAYYMAKENNTFAPGEGLVKEDVEETIKSISE